MRNAAPMVLVLAVAVLAPGLAEAYIGPGAGITAIGSALALIGAILLAIVGFIWYPIKRLRAKWRDRNHPQHEDQALPPQ